MPIKGYYEKEARPTCDHRQRHSDRHALAEPQLSAIDSWMEKHDVATRPEAIRRLVGLGLQAKK